MTLVIDCSTLGEERVRTRLVNRIVINVDIDVILPSVFSWYARAANTHNAINARSNAQIGDE